MVLGRSAPAIFASWIAAGLALACSGSESVVSASTPGGGAFPATPLTTLSTASGGLVIDVRSVPQPPSRGANTVQLTIRNAATGASVSGLTIAAVPWMPAMGHGSSIVPKVTETTPGTYVIDDVYLFMPGTWQLKLTFSGPSSDHAEPSFSIP